MGRRAAVAAGVIVLLVAGIAAADVASPLSGGRGGDAAVRRPATGATLDGGTTAAAGGEAAVLGAADGALTAGLRLLDQAATAIRLVSYQGVQVISWLAPGGSGSWLGSGVATMRVAVWHRGGLGTLTQVSTSGSARETSYLTDDPGSQLSDGLLGLTPALVSLLRTHYTVLYTGPGTASGRAASVVEAVRPDGTLAARFWLDRVTKLPLRREVFDTHAHLISEDALAIRRLGAPSRRASAVTFAATPAAATPVLDRGRLVTRAPAVPAAASQVATFTPWTDQLSSPQLATLRGEGWPVPRLMPGGLRLFDATQSSTGTGRVVDLGYSDGLSVVSLFVQRGQLPPALPGWTRTRLDGNQVYLRNPGEPDLTWSADGFVFTVVAGAPEPIVTSVVGALPHQARPGFWGRMRHGVRRLLSWAG